VEKKTITKISKSTETLRNIGRLSVTQCMYIWMEYLEKVLHVKYTHLFSDLGHMHEICKAKSDLTLTIYR